MKIIETVEELESEINKLRLSPPDIQQTGYLVDYECGCGERHPLNGSDGSIPILQEIKLMWGLSFLIKCRNNWITHVHQKGMGIVSIRCISHWSASEELFKDKL
tara:strand:+ start:347 stop:658 length:312 start_codon:yes stop_codon:yes gene_type:complete